MLIYAKRLVGFLFSRKAKGPETIKICVLGPPFGGKSAVVNQFIEALTDSSAPRLAVKLLFDPTQAAQEEEEDSEAADLDLGEETRIHRGTLEFDGKKARIEFVDIPGRLLTASQPPPPDTQYDEWPPIYQATAGAHMLLLVLGPHVLAQAEPPTDAMNRMLSHVNLAVARNPEVMIAVAYTKADEYGVVEPEQIRIVNDRRSASALEKLSAAEAGEVHQRWETFLDAVASAGVRGTTYQWGELRRTLLDRTRFLWESTIYQLQHRFVGGYFMAAQPVDSYYQPWTRRGLFQLFSDFFQHLRTIRARPKFGNLWTLLFVAVAIVILGFGIYERSAAQAAFSRATEATRELEKERLAWNSALAADSPEAYEAFAKENPDAPFAQLAMARTTQLENWKRDDEAWNKAVEESRKSAFETYLSAFPKGLHTSEARQEIQAIERQPERDAWDRAQTAHSALAYQRFLMAFPSSDYAGEARRRLEILQVETPQIPESYYLALESAWKEALRRQSVASFRRCVVQYPGSVLKEAALIWIEKYNARQSWPSAPGQDPSVTAPWRGYVAKEMENRAWQSAKSKNTVQGYREYRIGFPKGAQIDLAARRIRGLEADLPR